MPTAVPPPEILRMTTLSTDKRRAAVVSVTSMKRSDSTKKKSFWSSSNPDESDEDLSVAPSLSRGESAESVNSSTSPRVRPNSASTTAPRKKYVPRSAAKSFMITTTGASEDKRKSYRRTMKLDEDADLVCLTEEQQAKWAKLMSSQGAKKETQAPDRVDILVGRSDKYANAQALAALEAGQPQ